MPKFEIGQKVTGARWFCTLVKSPGCEEEQVGVVTAYYPAGSDLGGRSNPLDVYAVLWPGRRSVSLLYNHEQLDAV